VARVVWLRFLAWTLVGLCLALGVSQVGLVTIPIGVVLAVWLVRKRRTRGEMLGLLEGAGALGAVVGVFNLDYRPCPSGDVVLQLGQRSFSCGGFDGTPWLIVGLGVMALAAVLYWRLTVNT
jgi:hypothetical protein